MKKIVLSLILLGSASYSWACDKALQGQRDCQIQDRFQTVRSKFKSLNIDINDIAEYKVIRFIDRLSWENAKISKTPPHLIYGPAPITWNVWNKGIESLFPHKLSLKNLSLETFSQMNTVLLTNGDINIKDDRTDEAKPPGEPRKSGDSQIGFCSHEMGDHKAMAEASLKSMLNVQKQLEQKTKMPFQKLIAQEGGLDAGLATLGATLRGMVPGCGPRGDGVWVSYVRSELVVGNLDWIRIFIKTYLKHYENRNISLTPIAAAALVQKWFVTVHPFADGNGRTSRGLQDLILEHFDLPFSPGGDLQNDALEDYVKYVEMTYDKTEGLLTQLEECARQYESRSEISFACKTTKELNQ